MTDAITQMTKYAFENFPLHKIFATPFDFNISSHRVLEKAGFVLEAVLKECAIKNNKIVDLFYYSILKTRHSELVSGS